MGIVIVLVGEQMQFPLSDDLIAINQCQGSVKQLANDTSIPSCFLPPNNSSIPTPIKESTQLYNSTYTILFCMILTVVNYLLLVWCFWPKYRRVESENRASLEKSVVVK